MSQHFFLLTLVFACCSLRASSRYLGQPSYGHQIYSPYADYGYSGYPYQIPSYYPPGTYFDQRRGCLKPFPGGGVPIIVDYVSSQTKVKSNIYKN